MSDHEPLTVTLGVLQAAAAQTLAERWGVPVEEAVARALGEAMVFTDPTAALARHQVIDAIRRLPTIEQ